MCHFWLTLPPPSPPFSTEQIKKVIWKEHKYLAVKQRNVWVLIKLTWKCTHVLAFSLPMTEWFHTVTMKMPMRDSVACGIMFSTSTKHSFCSTPSLTLMASDLEPQKAMVYCLVYSSLSSISCNMFLAWHPCTIMSTAIDQNHKLKKKKYIYM